MFPMRILSILTLSLTLFAVSCHKSLSPAEQLAEDVKKIEKYLSEKGLTAQKTDSGLHYIITKEGTGSNPTPSSKVTVKYKGYYLDGKIFDQTTGTKTASFFLTEVIQGWTEGIPLLKKGGSGQFFVPSGLAYGPDDYNGVPGNSVLIFDVDLINF
jgi:FKBP-type peptidyl-prolyl cis-trans isomerase FkpA